MGDLGRLTDYRRSHLAKGPDYDEYIANDPWSQYMTAVEAEILSRIVRRLFEQGLSGSLDFACGTGRISRVMENLAKRSWGVDVSETMIAEARRKCRRTTFIVQDLTQQDLDIEPVGLITAFRFFGNAEDPLRLAALHAIRRHLDPGGYLIFNNHRNPWSIQECLTRLTGGHSPMDLDYLKIVRLLRHSGFRMVRAYGVGAWIVRHRLNRPELLHSGIARLLEPVSRLRLAAPFCPDLVIVARKTP
jgi:SAM-dependent methyltransferase